MGRPREFDVDKVIAALKETFWLKGYEGASYADLTAATGLKKGSLYAAFGDKRALYLKALEDYNDREVSGGVALLTDSSGASDGRKRIETLLGMVADAVRNGDRRGCLLCDAASDQAQLDPIVEKAVSASFMRIENAFAHCLADMSQNPIKGDAAQRTASWLTSVYFGMRIMAKAGAPLAMLEEVHDVTLEKL